MMEDAIAVHGEKNFFLGSRPTRMISSWNHIVVIVGISVSRTARIERDPSKQVQRKVRDS